MTKIAIIYHSGYGHTAAIAEAVSRGASSVEGTEVTTIKATEVENHWDALDAADGIIFGTPTYMGSIAWQLKKVLEETSGRWMQQSWKDKIAAGFTVSASWSGDKLNSLTDLTIFAMQHSMIWVGLGLLPGFNHSKATQDDLNRTGHSIGVGIQANADQGNEGMRESDFKTAEALGKRVAETAKRWKAGA